MGGIVAMSSTINASTASGGGVITTADASGILQLQTAGVTALSIDASQNVGIGTSSPNKQLQIQYGSTNSGQLQITNNSTGTTATDGVLFGYDTSNDVIINNQEATATKLYTSGTERMRIDSSGNLLVGTTSALSTGSISFVASGAGGTAMLAARNSATAAGKFWTFGPDNGNAFRVFNQTPNGVYVTDGATSWSAFSDERLKTDLIPIENGLEKVNSLRSVTGRFKTDEEGVSRSFLIAQDVQKVLPEAVSVQDDELGTLGVAYTEVIPLLVASIKELKAIIDTQNARIEALEAK